MTTAVVIAPAPLTWPHLRVLCPKPCPTHREVPRGGRPAAAAVLAFWLLPLALACSLPLSGDCIGLTAALAPWMVLTPALALATSPQRRHLGRKGDLAGAWDHENPMPPATPREIAALWLAVLGIAVLTLDWVLPVLRGPFHALGTGALVLSCIAGAAVHIAVQRRLNHRREVNCAERIRQYATYHRSPAH
ncbi:hypothetical protein [Kitasatospora purpeofusca]|uniref:hypothetical protein n=1 Tax=Kitasatospora purpeofusca TaxID=67352 RepID=UPI002A5A6557|nr:hypothetical protein [Kitasatospora purpeofusca]MDY0811086.1 hypothetical protein [Kitasatospora purpeofusca]